MDVIATYDKAIKSEVTDYEGNIVTENEKGEELVAEDVSVEKQYKKHQKKDFTLFLNIMAKMEERKLNLIFSPFMVVDYGIIFGVILP